MRVICTLPHASDKINGVQFTPGPAPGSMISEDIAPELAARFARIPGYALAEEPATGEPALPKGRPGRRG